VCVQWLSDHGYGSWTPDHDATPKPAFVHSARAFVKGDKVLSQKVRETSGTDSDSDDDLPQIARVTVTESRKGVMAVVLSSTYTAQMNAISSTTLYCFYPNLANSLYCLQSDLTRNHLNRRVWSPFKYQDTNSDWAEPCGPFCPAVPRKTKGDQGVASFRWNPRIDVPPSRDPHTDHLLAEQTLKWRYSKFCRNRGCSLYTPVASSSRLI
jgi:hypothetical protein